MSSGTEATTHSGRADHPAPVGAPAPVARTGYAQRGLEERCLAVLAGGWIRRAAATAAATGCLLWIVALIIVLVVMSLLFGGFQKGTRWR